VVPEETAIARQRPDKHAATATDTHVTTEEPREAVLSVRPVPRLCKEGVCVCEEFSESGRGVSE
jgi:hypothetical protein